MKKLEKYLDRKRTGLKTIKTPFEFLVECVSRLGLWKLFFKLYNLAGGGFVTNHGRQETKGSSNIIRVPVHLIFSHGRPLVCSHIYDLYDKEFSREARENYLRWFDRVKSLNKKLWHKPHKYPGEYAIRNERKRRLRDKYKLYFEVSRYPHSAGLVETFDSDRFTIMGTRHRHSIWISRGAKYLYLPCSKEIWRDWNEREKRVYAVAKEYMEYRMNIRNKKPYQPIETVFENFVHSKESYGRLNKVLRPVSRDDIHILDIGCNIGFFSRYLARMNKQVTGIDTFQEHIEWAKKITAACRLNIEFQNIPFQSLPEDKTYDVVMDLTVLWHLLYSHKTMSEEMLVEKLKRICKRKLISECANQHYQRYKKLILNNTHLRHYTKLGVARHLGGFRELGVFSAEPWEDNDGEYDFTEWGDKERLLYEKRKKPGAK